MLRRTADSGDDCRLITPDKSLFLHHYLKYTKYGCFKTKYNCFFFNSSVMCTVYCSAFSFNPHQWGNHYVGAHAVQKIIHLNVKQMLHKHLQSLPKPKEQDVGRITKGVLLRIISFVVHVHRCKNAMPTFFFFLAVIITYREMNFKYDALLKVWPLRL